MSHTTNVTREMVMRAVMTIGRCTSIVIERSETYNEADYADWERRLEDAQIAQATATGAIMRMLADEMGLDTEKLWRSP